jgi:hypothetical protein
VAEPNRLQGAAVPNTIGSTTPHPSPSPAPTAAANGVLDDDGDVLDAYELDDADDLDEAHAVADQVAVQADLDRRVREAVDTALADQTKAVAAARRRGRIGFVAGLLLAAAGIPLFFGASLASEEAGIALICLGVGVALLSVLIPAARADIAASRRSTAAAVTTTLLLPHTAIVWVAAIGLVAFGLLVLLVAAQTP